MFIALLAGGLGIGGGIAYYLFTETFENTKKVKAAYTVSAVEFLKEFERNDSLANGTYRNQIVEVKGRVSSIEWADTSATLKIDAIGSGDYLIFDFQQEDAAITKTLKPGDSVFIRAACSGSIYSRILNSRSVQFKRATLIQQF